jgi:hypothetical protein
MSFDLSVWYSSQPVGPEEGGPFHVALCEGHHDGLESSPRVRRFVDELIARYPQIDDVPEDKVDECPWTIAFDQSEGHVIMCIAWSRAEEMKSIVHGLADKHGLVCYDPQADEVHNPPGREPSPQKKSRPWWKFWS